MADNFANRILLSGSAASATGSNIGATGEVGEPSQSGVINSAWWSWTPSYNGTYTINTKNSNFDTWLSVFDGNQVNSLNLIKSDDDAGGNLTSLVSLYASAGATYQIAVDGFSGNTGNIQLNIVPVVIYGTRGRDFLVGTAYPETINGLGEHDVIYGEAGNDTLNGNEGDDRLDGGLGADQLAGGLGIDTYVVDNVGDVVNELPDQGIDRVESSVTYTLSAEVENLSLSGTAAIDGTGNNLPNVITGNSASNLLDGSTGVDQLTGRLGNDFYNVDNEGDVVIESPFEGIDSVYSVSTYTLPAEVENLILRGPHYTSDGVINGTGNNLPNLIIGNQNNNTLNGEGGADKLNGEGGQDILTGGTGTNTFVFQFGRSLVSAPDHVTDFEVGSSKIDLLTYGSSEMSAPSSFSRAANSAATTLSDLVAQAFIDANGALAGSQALGINSAALIVATNASIAGNYLVINDATAGFDTSNDLVIKLTTAGAFPPVGAIPITDFFV